MPRTPIIVNFDGKDHRILDGEATACGQIAPQGLPWESETTKPCPVCFPDGKKKAQAELAEAQALESPVPAPADEPAKPTTKATKAK